MTIIEDESLGVFAHFYYYIFILFLTFSDKDAYHVQTLTDKKVLSSPAQDCSIYLLFFIPQGRYYSIQIY